MKSQRTSLPVRKLRVKQPMMAGPRTRASMGIRIGLFGRAFKIAEG